MCKRWMIACLIASFLTLPAGMARAQFGGSLISEPAARRMGLERRWFAQAQISRTRSRLAHITAHINSRNSHTEIKLRYDGREVTISEYELNAYQEPIGPDGAQARADELKADLEAQGYEVEMESRRIPDITLYVSSDLGVLHSIDGETGSTRWVARVGTSEFPAFRVAVSDELVAVVNGLDFYVLNAKDGLVAFQRRLEHAPGAGPAFVNGYVFVPTVTGRVEAYELANPKFPTTYMSHGTCLIQPTSNGTSVAWPTELGHMNVARPPRAGVRYRVETYDAILTPPVFAAPDRVLFSTASGNVYCVDERYGDLLWRYITVELMTEPVHVAGDRVYAITEKGLLTSLDLMTGDVNWITSGVHRFVAASDQRVYGLDRRQQMVILDRESGSRVGTLATLGIEFTYGNMLTDRIYLASDTGLIQCLHEMGRDWPLIHLGQEEASADDMQQEDAAEPVVPDADVNPFGAPAANPFGAPAGGGGAGAGETTSPFGTPRAGGAGGAGAGGGGGGSSDDPFGIGGRGGR